MYATESKTLERLNGQENQREFAIKTRLCLVATVLVCHPKRMPTYVNWLFNIRIKASVDDVTVDKTSLFQSIVVYRKVFLFYFVMILCYGAQRIIHLSVSCACASVRYVVYTFSA